MISALARWVAVAVILATGGTGTALIAATVCSTSFSLRQRGFTLMLLACVAAVVYAVGYAVVPGFSQ